MLPSDVNDERAAFMAAHGLTHCEWDDNGLIRAATRDANPPRTVPIGLQSAKQPTPAADLAARILAQRERQHQIMYAASSAKPAMTSPAPPPSVVPRAVRAKQDASGGAQK